MNSEQVNQMEKSINAEMNPDDLGANLVQDNGDEKEGYNTDDKLKQSLYERKIKDAQQDEMEVLEDEIEKTYIVEVDKKTDLEDLVFNPHYFNSIGIFNIQVMYQEYGGNMRGGGGGGRDEQQPYAPQNTEVPKYDNVVPISGEVAPIDPNIHAVQPDNIENYPPIPAKYMQQEKPSYDLPPDAVVPELPPTPVPETPVPPSNIETTSVSLPYSYFSYFFKRMQNKPNLEDMPIENAPPKFEQPEETFFSRVMRTFGGIIDNVRPATQKQEQTPTEKYSQKNMSIVDDEIKISTNGKWIFEITCKNEPVKIDDVYLSKSTYEEKEDILDACIDQINQQKKYGAIINGIYKVDDKYIMIGEVIDILYKDVPLFPLFMAGETKSGTKLDKYKNMVSK